MPLALSFSAASSTFFWINSTKDQKKFHPGSNPNKSKEKSPYQLLLEIA
jgi:hypothetical protein